MNPIEEVGFPRRPAWVQNRFERLLVKVFHFTPKRVRKAIAREREIMRRAAVLNHHLDARQLKCEVFVDWHLEEVRIDSPMVKDGIRFTTILSPDWSVENFIQTTFDSRKR